MIKRGILYQDKRGNAVFVRRDENGNIVGAEVHGTNTFKRYKGIIGDGDNVVSFRIGEPNKVYVFDLPIKKKFIIRFSFLWADSKLLHWKSFRKRE